MAPSTQNKAARGKVKAASSLTRLMVVKSPRSSPPPPDDPAPAMKQKRRVSFLAAPNDADEILPIESTIDIKRVLLPATSAVRRSSSPAPAIIRVQQRVPRGSASPAPSYDRAIRTTSPALSIIGSHFASQTGLRRSASPNSDGDDVKPALSSTKGSIRRSASPAPHIGGHRFIPQDRILLSNHGQVGSSTEAGPSVGTKDQPPPKITERRCYKLRGREDSLAWFEISTYKRLNKPPRFADETPGLSIGDLLVNWLDIEKKLCQVWRLTLNPDDGKAWTQALWGAPDGDHRLIVTDKGQPSLVAESTWKKKYKLQGSRIVA